MSSRAAPAPPRAGSTLGGQDYTVAALVQANHGIRPWLTILGQPVGQLMPEDALYSGEMGSIIVIVATDAPLSGLALRQLAKRAAIGIGRGGTPGGNNSGDIFLAFSTANPGPMPQFAPAADHRTRAEHRASRRALPRRRPGDRGGRGQRPCRRRRRRRRSSPQGMTCRALDLNRLQAIFATSP